MPRRPPHRLYHVVVGIRIPRTSACPRPGPVVRQCSGGRIDATTKETLWDKYFTGACNAGLIFTASAMVALPMDVKAASATAARDDRGSEAE